MNENRTIYLVSKNARKRCEIILKLVLLSCVICIYMLDKTDINTAWLRFRNMVTFSTKNEVYSVITVPENKTNLYSNGSVPPNTSSIPNPSDAVITVITTSSQNSSSVITPSATKAPSSQPIPVASSSNTPLTSEGSAEIKIIGNPPPANITIQSVDTSSVSKTTTKLPYKTNSTTTKKTSSSTKTSLPAPVKKAK